MGYIQDLDKELQKRFADLDEERQKELIKFIKEKIIESFRNGIMSGKMVKAGKQAERKTREFSRGE